MAQKRNLWEEEVETEGSLVPEVKRRRTLLYSMREVIAARSMHPYFPKMEPFLRKVVQEEVQNALCRFTALAPRVQCNKIQTTVNKRYKLQFQNTLPGTLFTSNKIEAEGQKPVEIVIIDSLSKKKVTSGPLSSMKIEILVLDGDFASDGQEEWTEKEFDSSIVPEREGKRPLLTGKLETALNNGIGQLADINFTDNSSWIRSRKFRLGARVTPHSDIVLEAITGAFVVKDHRGEAYKKHHPPSLADDIWRLEKIGKGGVFHQKLEKYGIVTVQDFLKKLIIDQEGLRNLLGMSNKMWDATVEHAWECIIPRDKLYTYCNSGVVLLFNSIYQLVGAMLNSNFYLLEEIPASQTALVNKVKQDAYRSPVLIVEINQQSGDNCQGLLSTAIEDSTVGVGNWSNEHIPLHSATSQGDQVACPATLHLPIPQGNDLIVDPTQRKDNHSCPHPHYAKQSFQTTNFNLRDCYNTIFANVETTELAEPIMNGNSNTGLNSQTYSLCSSMSPEFWDVTDKLAEVSRSDGSENYATSASVHHVGACASPVNWSKLIATLGG